MGGKLRFDDRVVLVTGAGNGLGKAYALEFARRGAKVIVNDLGGDIKGGGKSARAADLVVEEIKANGGTAVANYNSVEDGEKLVQTALENYGRIDVVVNNAGILRDRSFSRTSDLDWDLIHRVHLRGPFMVTRAAWETMKKQKYGRVIMTTSTAGIFGNFGQANYSAAKLGVLGLSNTLAIEGSKYNIHCNTLAPVAGSRLTQTVWPDEMVEAMKPDYVMPLVLWLCHEDCNDTGGLFESGAGWTSKFRWERTQGAILGPNATPEDIRDNWEKIQDFSDSTPANTQDSRSKVNQALSQVQPRDTSGFSGVKLSTTSSTIDPSKAVGYQLPEETFSYDERDVILYNLGVGVSTSQPDHLKFLFEMRDDFCVLPTYMVIPAMSRYRRIIPGLMIDPTMVLHGEQYLEVFKQIPTNATLTTKSHVADILDKGRGALIIYNVDTFDESGEKVAFNQHVTYVQKAGGFGGKRSSEKPKETMNPPKRAPDASIKEAISVDQAALYRLSGDRNPLHIDPGFAAQGGFAKPILHGLCSFGFGARHVLQQYCDNDVSKFKAVKVRFSRPVLPGQTLQTDMWKEGNRIFFNCKVAETGEVSISGAYMDITGTVEARPTAGESPDVDSNTIFQEMERRVTGNPAVAKKINVIYLFNLTKGGKPFSKWTIDCKSSPPAVYQGEPKGKKADCTMTMAEDDFIGMSLGQKNGQQLFMSGKLKIAGNIMASQKLGDLFADQPASKL